MAARLVYHLVLLLECIRGLIGEAASGFVSGFEAICMMKPGVRGLDCVSAVTKTPHCISLHFTITYLSFSNSDKKKKIFVLLLFSFVLIIAPSKAISCINIYN